MAPRRLPVVIDTDPGIDDAMAIAYALSDPRLEVLALTTVFGNVPVATATRNALHLGRVYDCPVPVHEGAARPLVQDPAPHPDFVHGVGGLGAVLAADDLPDSAPGEAAEALAEAVEARPGEVTLIALGPLTNLALALERHPAIADLVRGVVVMGGALRTRGNVTEHAEANIWQDPHAAARVLGASWSVEMVGLDVTERVRLALDDLARLRDARPVTGGLLAEAAETYFAFHREHVGLDGCFLHDPTAIVRLACPELFETVRTPVEVTLSGEAAGRTREGGEGPAVTVCLGVAAEAVRRRFLDVIATGPLP